MSEAEEIFQDEQVNENHDENCDYRFKREFVLLRALIISLLLFGAYKFFTASFWFCPSGIFDVPGSKIFLIRGCNLTSPENVSGVMKSVKIGKTPLFMINPDDFEKKIKKIPTVKNVHVIRRLFPTRFEVNIEDRKPLFAVYPEENSEPLLLFVEGSKLADEEYIKKGLKFNPLKVICKYSKENNFFEWDYPTVERILNMANIIRKNTGGNIKYIDVSNMSDIFVKTDISLVRVGMFDETFDKRMENLYTLEDFIKHSAKKPEYIDLRWDNVQYVKYKDNKPETISPAAVPQNSETTEGIDENFRNTAQN